ncbi:FixH family protein [Paraferrimonas sedimenticola]|uniref:Nitrogen fixation protein FixH n=1 Tax=Paraferrimonas sedimenticola TaxID=375674 RepID=A0AA37W0V2_9GAMM|nr:FixH family protein [Paraferrimonas sedimenticola]GLP96088.1 hypothetical protein GCM10007895_13940 [Paraferrimonas sedimenticola]
MNKPTPWYKQFWPWVLIGIPASAVISSLFLVKIAVDNKDSLVAEDYYKKGKAINLDLAKIDKARELGLQFSMVFNQGELTIKQVSGDTHQGAIALSFYHPTLPERDKAVMLTADGSGNYRLETDKDFNGNWEVQLDSYDHSWRLQKRIHLPRQAPIEFK